MTLSSPINDKYFHEWFSQHIVSNPEISSCSDTNLVHMSSICLSVRSVVFAMEVRLFWKFFPKNIADSVVTAINISQIIECSSPSPAPLQILFCLFRTWSFTRFTNDLDSTDNSNSAVSLPMMKFWEFATSWELILSSCFFVPYGLRNPSRRISSWPRRTFRTIFQEVLTGRPDRSYVSISVFHSWEDQARSSSHFE